MLRSSAAYNSDGSLIPLQVYPTTFDVWNEEIKRLCAAMAKFYTKGVKVEEEDVCYVGCGRRLPFGRAYCSDIDPAVGEGIAHFEAADVTKLPYIAGRFLWVMSSHTLEHVADAQAALKEQLRVVTLGGVVGAVVPDVRWTAGLDPTHIKEWQRDEFAEAMAVVEAGPLRMELRVCDEAQPNYSFLAVWERVA